MAVAAEVMTAEALERMAPVDGHVELVRGELVMMTPAGHEHGAIALKVGAALLEHVRSRGLGTAYSAETGFVLARDPDTVRAPDAAFVTAERVARQTRREGFFEGAPDLAVEVISPSESDEAVHAKVLEYLRAGTRLVWVLHPRTRTVEAYRSLKDIRVLTVDDTLDGLDLLPDFVLPVADLFD
jgi:Uma2 family endonuclease